MYQNVKIYKYVLFASKIMCTDMTMFIHYFTDGNNIYDFLFLFSPLTKKPIQIKQRITSFENDL